MIDPYRLIIAPKAASELAQICDRIAKDSPQNAVSVATRIMNALELIRDAPHRPELSTQQRGSKFPVRSWLFVPTSSTFAQLMTKGRSGSCAFDMGRDYHSESSTENGRRIAASGPVRLATGLCCLWIGRVGFHQKMVAAMDICKRLSASQLVLLASAILLAGCLSVPLGDPEKSTVDSKLVGWWEADNQSEGDRGVLSVQEYDPRTYLIVGYSYSKDGEAITAKGSLIYKAWLTPIADARFLTMEIMNPQPTTPKDPEKERYCVMLLKQGGEGWSVRQVSDDFLKDCTSSDALRRKITDNVNNDALYGDEKTVTYHKASDDLTQSVLKAF